MIPVQCVTAILLTCLNADGHTAVQCALLHQNRNSSLRDGQSGTVLQHDAGIHIRSAFQLASGEGNRIRMGSIRTAGVCKAFSCCLTAGENLFRNRTFFERLDHVCGIQKALTVLQQRTVGSCHGCITLHQAAHGIRLALIQTQRINLIPDILIQLIDCLLQIRDDVQITVKLLAKRRLL